MDWARASLLFTWYISHDDALIATESLYSQSDLQSFGHIYIVTTVCMFEESIQDSASCFKLPYDVRVRGTSPVSLSFIKLFIWLLEG